MDSPSQIRCCCHEYLKNNNVKLALDAGGATWAQAEGRGKVAANELGLIEQLQGLGVKVDHISLQSVLSKPFKAEGQKVDILGGGQHPREQKMLGFKADNMTRDGTVHV